VAIPGDADEAGVGPRYLDGIPNGQYRDIAAITNLRRDVVGLMPPQKR